MASFQVKIGWKRLRKRENKNYRFVSFLADALWKIPKKYNKITKKKKIPLWLHFKPKSVERGWERDKIKIIVSFRPVRTWCVIENSKKIAKRFKKLNITIMAPFRAKIGWKRLRNGENKNYRILSFRS